MLSPLLEKAKKPAVLVGGGALLSQGKSADAQQAVLAAAHALAQTYPALANAATGYRGVGFVHTAAARVAALDLGFVPGPSAASSVSASSLVFLLNADPLDLAERVVPAGAFVVYQGHTGDVGANRADVILPAAAYTEKTVTYVNLDGRPQRTRKVGGLGLGWVGLGRVCSLVRISHHRL